MLIPDGTPELNDLIYGLVCHKIGRDDKISVTRMLELYEIFHSIGKHYCAGVAAALADEAVRS